MELDFKGTQLSGYSLVVNTALFSEETLESIVSDACPDILRILNTNAYACIKSKEVRDGRVEVRGVIYAQVLYLPDGEEGVRHIDVSIPFSGTVEHSAIRAGCVANVSSCVLSADARMLNPRKIYVRAEITLKVSCYSAYEKKMIFGCDADPKFGVQEKRENQQLCMIKEIRSKNFSLAEDLTLPGSKPDPDEILSYNLSISCSESKIIGSKLIFKGQALLNILYRSTSGQLVTASFELPFSQVMEATEGAEEAECDLDILATDITCRTDREEPRIISAAVSFMAQAVLRETQSMELLVDIYSTTHELLPEFSKEELCQFSGCESMRQDIREVIETSLPVKSVIDSVVSMGGVKQSWEGKSLKFTADVRINALYQSEDGEYYAITRQFPVIYQLEANPAYRYDPQCRCCGERHMTPTTAGIEVRLPVEFFWRMDKQQSVMTVERATLDAEATRDHAGSPSVVLRMVENNEDIWAIAKTYHTTMKEIREANDLPEHGMIGGQMLLIPRKSNTTY